MQGEAQSQKPCPDCGRPAGVPGASVGESTQARFCPHCGQKLLIPPLHLGEVLGGALASLWSFDLPILRTARALLTRPGHVARSWLRGKRRTFSNPLQFLVLIGAIVAILHPLVQAAHQARAVPGRATFDVALGQPGSGYFAFICIGLLVPVALTMRGLGSAVGARRPWLEWYVLGLYCYAIGAALQLVLHAASLWIEGSTLRTLVLWIKGLLPILYMILGSAGFVDRGQRARAVTLCIASHVLLVALAMLYGYWKHGAG